MCYTYYWQENIMTNEEELTKYIENKVKPITINERAKSKLATLLIEYPLDFLRECVDISFSKYICYDKNGKVEVDSFNEFFNKIGGIAHNRSLNPIDREISHILNLGSSTYSYWNDSTARTIIKKYVAELKNNKWNDDNVLQDIQNEVIPLFKSCANWSQWRGTMEGWIKDIISWQTNIPSTTTIDSKSSIIPNELIENTQRNLKP